MSVATVKDGSASSRAAPSQTPSAQALAWVTPEERRELIARSWPVALGILAIHIAFYGLTLWGAIADAPWWVTLPCAVLNGVAMGLLFTLGHDCSHGSYVQGKRFNQILARIAFIPIVHSASLWDATHNRNHHGKTNLKGVDPVWTPISKAEYDAKTPAGQLWYRIHRGPWGPLSYYFFENWLWRFVLPLTPDTREEWRRHVFDSVFIVGAFIATLSGIVWAGSVLAPDRPVWLTLVQGWLLPYIAWNYLMGLSIYLNHTHPNAPWFDDPKEWTAYNGNVRGTTHVDLPINLFPIWQISMHHTAHHSLQAIPIYKLDAAQRKIIERFDDDIVRYRLTPGEYLNIMRSCKLYDFKRHCWTDFDGHPTTTPVSLRPGPGRSLNPML